MLLKTLIFYTMLFIPPCCSPPSSSLVGHKQKLHTLSYLAHLAILILCFLVHTSEAGVIKKRDTLVTLKQNDNTAAPTVLTAVLNNSSGIFSTKLQFVNSDQNFATESSKELTNNEILFNNKIRNDKNDTETENRQSNGSTSAKSADIPQETANELSGNIIKKDKFPKLNEKDSLKISATNPSPPSRILTELKTETEENPFVQSKSLDINLENSQEYIKNELNLDNKETLIKSLEDQVTSEPLELTTVISKSKESAFESKTNEIKELELQLKSLENATKTSTVTESIPVLETSSIKDQSKSVQSLTKTQSEQHSNQMYDSERLKSILTTPDPLLTLEETTVQSLAKYPDLLRFEADKQDYARSMFREDTTEQELPPITTFKPVKDGIEEFRSENLDDQIEEVDKNDLVATLSVKEKKPKFINDNSTNAQQLNLPNNADVWSLAGMKSLPKANITMETAQTHNNTSKELKEMHNTSLTLNNNSEKNLLDWSQIMMDKELSTTARNEGNAEDEGKLKEIEKKQEEIGLVGSTTSTPENEGQEFKTLSGLEVITKNSLIEQVFTTTTSTIPTTYTSTTISSFLNYKENDNANSQQPDKKVVEENMNNDIDTLTATQTTATVATTKVDNNPFNTSVNIEPNLNEINLTSNQNQDVLNNDVYTITTTQATKTTAGMKNAVDEDINANTQIEMSTEGTTLSTTAISTTDKIKATAVVIDMTTTLEQISSETTTASMLETSNQKTTTLNNVDAISEQQKNKTNNVINEESNYAVSVSYNELENTLVDKKQNTPTKNIDLNTTTNTTTAVPITTFRPNILAITPTTSIPPKIIEQEVDQNGNEIQTNLKTNAEQESIIKTDLQYNHSTKAIETHLTAREFETTTIDTLTTTSAAAAAAPELSTSKIENTLTSSWENESRATTSSSRDETINVTTEINFETIETRTTSTQNTPKKVVEHKNLGDKETTTGSAVFFEQGKFEKNGKTTTTETIYSLATFTETPVVSATESTTAAIPTTTTTTPEQNTTAGTAAKQETDTTEKDFSEDVKIATTAIYIMNNNQEITTTTTAMPATTVKEEETYISLLDDATTTTTTATSKLSTEATVHATTLTPPSSTVAASSTLPSAITTKVEEIYNVINSTTTELIHTTTITAPTTTTTTTQQFLTEIEEESSTESYFSTTASSSTEMLPTLATTTAQTSQIIATADIGSKTLPTLTSIMGGNSGNMYPKNSEASGETDVNVIIAITVSVIGVIALVLLVGFLYLMRKRQKQTSYSQRCRPVSLDEYTIDNASVNESMRKSSVLRASKRTYGNLAFDDPALRPNPLSVQELAKFVQERLRIFEEFRDVPQITSRLDEVPTGCEDKNRYANVLPLPETRVILQRLNDDDKSEYINANYVTGPKDPPNYYIACQAPLESTVEDFWRMIWEQQSRVIIQATDLIENGVEKCAEYLPPSVTLDNHSSFGDFQITLQNREVKDKYAISTILMKHIGENATRELTHYWYKWPEMGVPTEEAPIIAMLLEARSSLISYAIEQANEDKEKLSTGTLKSAEDGTTTAADESTTAPINNLNGSTANTAEINGNISMVPIKKPARNQGPLTIHCSPGTGRTGTIIACDIAIRSLETPKRTVDIPQIVYYVRRGRASAVLTKEQYEFIYKVACMYAAKITNPTNYN